MPPTPTEKTGAEIVEFLKSFEGAASAFTDEDETWALWIPEIVTSDFPVSPGSQIFFPVILRHGTQLIAIRFFYDCRTGKIKFYTGTIPASLALLPEFEHAVSELFRHSLPVEPIKQRQLRRSHLPTPRPLPKRPHRTREDMSIESTTLIDEPQRLSKYQSSPSPTNVPEPVAALVPHTLPEAPDPAPTPILLPAPLPPAAAMVKPAPTARGGGLRVEICDSTRRVLQVLILVIGILGIAALAAFVYLQINEDPGLKHHRMQLEQQRLRSGQYRVPAGSAELYLLA